MSGGEEQPLLPQDVPSGTETSPSDLPSPSQVSSTSVAADTSISRRSFLVADRLGVCMCTFNAVLRRRKLCSYCIARGKECGETITKPEPDEQGRILLYVYVLKKRAGIEEFLAAPTTKAYQCVKELALRRNVENIWECVMTENWINYKAVRIVEDHELMVNVAESQSTIKHGIFDFTIRRYRYRNQLIDNKGLYFVDSGLMWDGMKQFILTDPTYIHLYDEYYTAYGIKEYRKDEDLGPPRKFSASFAGTVWVACGSKIKSDGSTKKIPSIVWHVKFMCLKDRHLYYADSHFTMLNVYYMKLRTFKDFLKEDQSKKKKDRLLKCVGPVADFQFYLVPNIMLHFNAPHGNGFLLRRMQPVKGEWKVLLVCSRNLKAGSIHNFTRQLWCTAIRIIKYGHNLVNDFRRVHAIRTGRTTPELVAEPSVSVSEMSSPATELPSSSTSSKKPSSTVSPTKAVTRKQIVEPLVDIDAPHSSRVELGPAEEIERPYVNVDEGPQGEHIEAERAADGSLQYTQAQVAARERIREILIQNPVASVLGDGTESDFMEMDFSDGTQASTPRLYLHGGPRLSMADAKRAMERLPKKKNTLGRIKSTITHTITGPKPLHPDDAPRQQPEDDFVMSEDEESQSEVISSAETTAPISPATADSISPKRPKVKGKMGKFFKLIKRSRKQPDSLGQPGPSSAPQLEARSSETLDFGKHPEVRVKLTLANILALELQYQQEKAAKIQEGLQYQEATAAKIQDDEANNPRVAMDFSFGTGRVVDDPEEAAEIARNEGRGGSNRARFPIITDHSRDALSFGPHLTQSYYHPNMSRQEAENQVINANVDGAFLVRNSHNREGCLVITYLHNGKPIHQYIQPAVIRPYGLDDLLYLATCDRDTVFYDVHSLIDFYRLNRGTLQTILTMTVRNPDQRDKTPTRDGLIPAPGQRRSSRASSSRSLAQKRRESARASKSPPPPDQTNPSYEDDSPPRT